MAIVTLIVIFGYFLVRGTLQFSDFEKSKPVYIARLYKVYLACASFAVGSLSYIFDILTYNPSDWGAPPIPLWMFLGWLIIVVLDSLYQFQMMNSIRQKPESQIDIE
jgi:hypothetical protein